MLSGAALQQLSELADLGRHGRGGAGRVVDANVRDVAPGAALHALDEEAQRPHRSMADTREARKANIKRWGSNPKWIEYVNGTSLLVPWFPAKAKEAFERRNNHH